MDHSTQDAYDASSLSATNCVYTHKSMYGQPKMDRIFMAGQLHELTRLGRRFRRPQEKMPPRFTYKGFSLAVRTLGHEIRGFTQRTTGKDLATLATNRPEIFNKIENSALKFAQGSKQTWNRTLVTFHGISILASIKCSNSEELQSNTAVDSCCTNSSDEKDLSRFCLASTDVISQDRMESAMRFCKSISCAQDQLEDDDWERFLREENVSAWRRKLPNSSLYQYRVHGRFNDISAWNFYQTQMDIEYRKQWDRFALKMDLVGTDAVHKSDVIHWVTQFPYPLKSREYLFVRRSEVDTQENTIALISKAVTHPYVEETNDLVRIDAYESEMLIKSTTKLEEKGMEFLLTYYDDLKSNVPSYCLDMIVSSGLSEGMHKIYEAAKKLSSLAFD